MKKKSVLLLTLFISVILLTSLAFAANETLTSQEKGVQWLEDYLADNPCSGLSTETNAFVTMAIGDCLDELISKKNTDNYWVGSEISNNIIVTSQAILALEESSKNTDGSRDWLLTKTIQPNNLNWYLQIETEGVASTCTAKRAGSTENLIINADYTVAGGGTCLSVDSTGYKFSIAPTCFDQDLTISCDQAFGTTLLFQKVGGDTIYISESSASSSTTSPTVERVNSLCFSNNARACDYEASLWATHTLNVLGEDISAFMPYLIVSAEDNSLLMPEVFLSRLTGYASYSNQAIARQVSSQTGTYWDGTSPVNNKFYNTALGIYLLYPGSAPDDVESWVEAIQGTAGDWNDKNVRDTAFLIYSMWGTGSSGNLECEDTDSCDIPADDCEDSGYFCSTLSNCDDVGGSILSSYDCGWGQDCCDTDPSQTCSELGGITCSYTDDCTGTEDNSASDITSSQLCCIGTCTQGPTPPSTENACEQAEGGCYASCYDDEKEDTTLSSSCDSGKICCVAGTPDKPATGGSTWWIWVLLILIVLVVLGIIFRDKLKPLIDKFRKGSSETSSSSTSPRGFPPASPPGMRRPPRTVLPPSRPRPSPRKPMGAPNEEMDDVLNKLKKMGQ